MKRRIISFSVALVLLIQTCSVFAVDSNSPDEGYVGTIIFDYVADDNIRYVVTSVENEYSYTLYNYVDGELTNTYTEQKQIPIQPFAWTSDRYLGDMHYYNAILGRTYSIHCTIRDQYHPDDTYFTVPTGVEVAQAVIAVADFLSIPQTMASEAIQDLLEMVLDVPGPLDVIDGLLVQNYGMDLRADVSEHIITGVSTTDDKPTAEFYGVIATIRENVTGFRDEYIEGYTHRLWGTDYFGTAMFEEVYGVGYTPTSWSSS